VLDVVLALIPGRQLRKRGEEMTVKGIARQPSSGV